MQRVTDYEAPEGILSIGEPLKNAEGSDQQEEGVLQKENAMENALVRRNLSILPRSLATRTLCFVRILLVKYDPTDSSRYVQYAG